MYLTAMAIYIIAYSAGPPPSTVIEWFTLLQNNWLAGLFFLGFADIVIMICAVFQRIRLLEVETVV